MIEEPMTRGAVLDLILTNKEVLVGNAKVKGSLDCSGREMVDFRILRAVRRENNRFVILDFRKTDFALFSDLLG